MLETNNSDNWVVFQLFPNHQKKNLNHANSRPQNPKLKPKKKKKKNHPNQLSQTPGIPIQMGPTTIKPPQQKRIEIWSNSFKTKSNSKP